MHSEADRRATPAPPRGCVLYSSVNVTVLTCGCDVYHASSFSVLTCDKLLSPVHLTLCDSLTFLFVKPADAAAVVVRLEQQLSQELPQVDGLAGVVTHHL